MNELRLTVAVSNDFLKALNRLPESSRRKVASFIFKFRNNPRSSGLNYERIEEGKGGFIRSLRVDQEIRCIVRAPEEDNVYVLLWVDKHDDAYQWARRRTYHVDRILCALQVVDVESAEAAVSDAAHPANAQEPPTPASNEQSALLFEACDNDQLMLLGVPEVLLPAVRAVNTDEALSRLTEWLPQSCVEGLILLANGRSIEEVIDELERKRPVAVDTIDVATALDSPDSRAEFMVITDDDELKAMLSAPMEQWRVFLHPSQRRLVERDWNGPVCVLGGAGTGKTVVAIHKARWLAAQLVNNRQPGRLLFTTFARNLATDIRSNLTKICSSSRTKAYLYASSTKPRERPAGTWPWLWKTQPWALIAASMKKSGKRWCWRTAADHALNTLQPTATDVADA